MQGARYTSTQVRMTSLWVACGKGLNPNPEKLLLVREIRPFSPFVGCLLVSREQWFEVVNLPASCQVHTMHAVTFASALGGRSARWMLAATMESIWQSIQNPFPFYRRIRFIQINLTSYLYDDARMDSMALPKKDRTIFDWESPRQPSNTLCVKNDNPCWSSML